MGGESQRINLAPRWEVVWWVVCTFSMNRVLVCIVGIPTIDSAARIAKVGNTVVVVSTTKKLYELPITSLTLAQEIPAVCGGEVVYEGSEKPDQRNDHHQVRLPAWRRRKYLLHCIAVRGIITLR